MLDLQQIKSRVKDARITDENIVAVVNFDGSKIKDQD